jgi:hypothetical protein
MDIEGLIRGISCIAHGPYTSQLLQIGFYIAICAAKTGTTTTIQGLKIATVIDQFG